jgi:hypothetical protein
MAVCFLFYYRVDLAFFRCLLSFTKFMKRAIMQLLHSIIIFLNTLPLKRILCSNLQNCIVLVPSNLKNIKR